MISNVTAAARELQLELFTVEATLSEFEAKRRDIKARLVRLGAGTKVCQKCELEMDIEHFSRDRHKTDKRCAWCAKCWSDYRKTHPDRRRA